MQHQFYETKPPSLCRALVSVLRRNFGSGKKDEPKPPGPFDVLTPEFGYKGNPRNQFLNYLWKAAGDAKIEWGKRYDAVKTPEQATQYQQERRLNFHKFLTIQRREEKIAVLYEHWKEAAN